MDEVIMQYFSDEFEKKFGCNPMENKKARLKLEDAAQKCKKTLSANDQAPISVECLMEDEDLSGLMKREKFIELCEEMKKEVGKTVDRVIEKSMVSSEYNKAETEAGTLYGLNSLQDISFVEIVGGACRVPWFQEVLMEKFQVKDLSKTLNADECVARGCALQAAMLSPLYKVREFKVEDRVPSSITFTWHFFVTVFFDL
jgi:heat shock protein 4